MSKNRHLTPQEIKQVIDDYMQAYRMVHGEAAAEERNLTYRKGWFYFDDKVPYRAKEIEKMTVTLGKQITPRTDSDEDYPD